LQIGIKIAIGVISVILLIISITIISNTIRLTVHSRRKEISIMKYVGATNHFIRWPFVIEGIIIGILAAGITLLIVGTMYDFVIQSIEQSNVLQTMGVTLLQFSEIVELIGIVYLILGIGVGVVGSSISMKKYLEV
jgi:cell division transport system permease protein